MQIGNDDEPQTSKETPNSLPSKVLNCCGPLVTVRLLQSTISGNKGPITQTVLEVMENLQKDGIDHVTQNNNTTAFFKCLPCEVKKED